MARRPKLVSVTALVPTYIKIMLKRQAKAERRTLSAHVGNLLITHPRIGMEGEVYGKEKIEGSSQ